MSPGLHCILLIPVKCKLTAQSLMSKSIYVYMLSNYIIAIQYIRGYCYAITDHREGQNHAHVNCF